MGSQSSRSTFVPRALLVFILTGLSIGTSAEVTLVSTLPSGQPVGSSVDWLVRDNLDPKAFEYGLSVYRGTPGDIELVPRVLYDFSDKVLFQWTPLGEGSYVVYGLARNKATGEVTTAENSFKITSRVAGSPLVTGTRHPLVALYSAPPCPAGYKMRVRFLTLFPSRGAVTPALPCNGTSSMNFLLGGMLANKSYLVRHEALDSAGVAVAFGPILGHRTGVLPRGLPWVFPGPEGDNKTSTADSVLLATPLCTTGGETIPVATDLVGRVLWYYRNPATPGAQLWRPAGGGTFLINYTVGGLEGQGLREVNLSGDVIRETSAKRISEQLPLAAGEVVSSIHHEAIRLPNGHTAVLVSTERLLSDVQGVTGKVDIIGDWVVVLNRNWQVSWSWSIFDHLDIDRTAILGDICGNEPPDDTGCPPVLLVDGITEFANDWTHSNAIAYSPADGNLIVSVRHQDWVIKIDYQNGYGTGDLVWKLGPDGDFGIVSADPSPWFSHQHDANYISDNRVIVYDNGNLRCDNAIDHCESRGQVYALDETSMTATLLVNAGLGRYSFAVGSAQALSNGNFHFHSGLLFAPDERPYTEVLEVLSDGSLNRALYINQPSYRSFRLVDLYSLPGGDAPELLPP